MNRHVATWATVAIAVLGLTACSGAPAAPESPSVAPTSAPAEPTAPPVEETTPPPAEETTTSGQSLAEACLEPNAKMVEASAELAKANAALAASDGKDVQAMADALTAMGDYFGTLAESSSNPEVKVALTAIAAGYRKLGELYPKALVEQDLTAMAALATVMTDLQKAVDDFGKLCN